MGKVECKKYPKAAKEQQMQVRKLPKQQGIKATMMQTSADARIAALEAKLGIDSQSHEGDIKKMEGEALEEPAQGKNRGNPAVTHQALG